MVETGLFTSLPDRRAECRALAISALLGIKTIGPSMPQVVVGTVLRISAASSSSRDEFRGRIQGTS